MEDGLYGITPGFQGEYIENLEGDPEFMGTGEDFPYALSAGSLCINKGTIDNAYLPENYIFPENCLMENPRIYGWNIDIFHFVANYSKL